MEKEETNPWVTLNSNTVYENNWIAIDHREVINPNGGNGIYGVVRFKNIAIGILPIDEEGFTWIVKQFRYPLGHYTWEIPEGGGPIHQDSLDSAKRELSEEIGAQANKWELIQEMELSNSATNEVSMIYLATELSFHQNHPDETEQLEIKKIHFSVLVDKVLSGTIKDSLSVAAVLKALHLIKNGTLQIKNFTY
jgi:8-oxo-dGTP pyrophosphatase MutT (NUDIX family)